MEGRPQAQGVRKGVWTEEEDILLKKCISKYGEGKWHQVPQRAGLNRCRKSCRLRWLNYLRPNIKRGEFTVDEVDLMIRLQKLLGNRWSLISGRLPGRTANDVKNYWNTQIRKRMQKTIMLDENQSIINKKVNVIKPRPRTFCKNLRWMMLPGESPRSVNNNNNNNNNNNDIIIKHNNDNIISSDNPLKHHQVSTTPPTLLQGEDDMSWWENHANGNSENFDGPPASSVSWWEEESSAAILWTQQYTIGPAGELTTAIDDDFMEEEGDQQQNYSNSSMLHDFTFGI